jgi:hypothetical protein
LENQDPDASRNWQRSRAQALIEPVSGHIVREFFDVGLSRFTAVVIGEPQRAFYGNQFGLTFPLFDHFGVQLWVPEVGGPIDPGSDAHDLVMSLYGGMSKGERNRVKIRVRSRWPRKPRSRAGTWRSTTIRLPARGRRPASQAGQGRRRTTTARAGPRAR